MKRNEQPNEQGMKDEVREPWDYDENGKEELEHFIAALEPKDQGTITNDKGTSPKEQV